METSCVKRYGEEGAVLAGVDELLVNIEANLGSNYFLARGQL